VDGHPRNFGATGKNFSTHHAGEGIWTFRGDGTGTVKATSVSIVPPPATSAGGYPSFPADFHSDTHSFSFTYTVNDDGTWTPALVAGSFSGTFLRGPRTGQTYTIDKLTGVGLIGKNAMTLTIASVEPIVQTLSYSNGDVWPRVCAGSSVLIKLDDDGGGD
jgi:hypothetical protein